MLKLPTKGAIDLFNQGTIALAQVQHNGIRIDSEYLDKTIRKTKRKIQHLESTLEEDEVMDKWRERFRRKTSIGSNDQLGVVMYDILGFECHSFTPTGKYKTDESALAGIDHPFVKKFLRIKKLNNMLATYLIGVRREIVDGFIHPDFNLHLTQTYRSSSSAPNFQNIPIRNPEIGKLVRSAFIAREGCRIIETDYKGIEVSVAACYHKDPTMIADIVDPERDMHRDMAGECYLLPKSQVTKDVRYCGKHMFVFPQFYGDWFLSCSRTLWEAVSSNNLVRADGLPLSKHLEQAGITGLGNTEDVSKTTPGTFIHHIKEVEHEFWNVRYPKYTKWKKKWMEDYEKQGWFRTKTGFICQGFMKRNEAINYPVQGSAFHVLLYALIILQKMIKKRGMKTLIVGQIHDSIVADVPDDEVQEYLTLVNYVTSEIIPKRWKWIVVPMGIECEVAPVNGSWYQKKEWIYYPEKESWGPKKKE